MDSRTEVVIAQRRADNAQSPAIFRTTPERERVLRSLLDARPGIGMDTQCARLLAAMRLGPITLRGARRWLDVTHPSECVRRLRKDGYIIHCQNVTEASDAGVLHKTVAYELADN